MWSVGLITCLLGMLQGHAQIQFDIFLGYDGIVPEAGWMPVVCEVKNDGPGFTGVVEVESANQNDGTVTRLPVELPTGTLKRLTLPVFVQSSSYGGWDLRLRDNRGKVRAEQISVQPRRRSSWRVPLVGAIPRTPGGTPVLREVMNKAADIQPVAARFQTSIFPDNPLVLSAMSTLYLNSEKVPELQTTQARAIVGWLKSGGHLVVGIEQPGDVAAATWLKEVLPCNFGEVLTNANTWMIQRWVRTAPLKVFGSANVFAASSPFENLPGDLTFDSSSMLVTSCRVRDGEIIAGDAEMPFIVSAPRGRGRITVLLFSPEREPFRSWKNLPSFWARLANVPAEWYVSPENSAPGGWSSDGVLASMIETTQVQRLPLHWLLLLLLAYLIVIGPLDQYWLRRLGKPMLTWITFPCYVIFFSLLIYGIGYKLRAGDSEWNELHIVDVLSDEPKTELRGSSFLSAYSPANETFELMSPHPFGTLRPEFTGYGGGQSGDRVMITQLGDTFKAEVFVPVWASRFYANEWFATGESPVRVKITTTPSGWQIRAENRTLRNLRNIHVAVDGVNGRRIGRMPELGPRQITTWNLSRDASASGDTLPSEALGEMVQGYAAQFQHAVQSRRRSFGASQVARIVDLPASNVALSFLSSHEIGPQQYGGGFIVPRTLDLNSTVNPRSAVFFAWDPGHSPAPKLYRFKPKRAHQDTMWRVAVAIQ